MITSLAEIQHSFTRDMYPPNEKNISNVPLQDILSFLQQNFTDNYEYRITNAGICLNSNGQQENFVAIALKVPVGDGYVTVPGASQGTIGISGLIWGALRNAVLRHLGAGTELYEYEEGQEPQFNQGPANGQQQNFVPGNTYGQNRQGYGQQGYQRPQNSGNNFGPWTGYNKNGQPIVIKSGQHIGQAWINLDMNDLNAMASRGNGMAQMELRRRAEMGGPGNTNQQYGQGGNFPPNAFNR
jgi:hypothetical protein